MGLRDRYHDIRYGFEANFWVANTLELFERLAFYGANAVMVVFIADRVGLKEDASTLAGIFSGLIFFLPVIAGVFVDRYGFKKSLTACFAIFALGYFLIGLAGMEAGRGITEAIGRKTYIIAVLVITAIGGSLIKPCIVGTVDRTSKPSTKALGFAIYYTLVNFGGAIGPLLALPVRQNFGIEFVLIVSSVTSLLLLLGTRLFFREPPAPAGATTVRTFGKVFRDMLMVFANFRFISFLIIFSGFWIMFWQIFFLLPLYTLEVLRFEHFELLETIDAWCIILLTVPVTVLTRKFKPIVSITAGLALASLSWIIVGVGGTIAFTVLGITLFALGESLQSPRFYEYVASLAPPDQTGTFMGFAFLPVAIGAFVGGFLADVLRTNYMTTDPSMMWYLVAGVGAVAVTLMILYNMFLAPRRPVETPEKP
ncbi:MAG TPA: MFS transporter [Cyclobacteriaceae bacterium]|nr:MFS transporter [Cyclobacteriaceae bacterium]